LRDNDTGPEFAENIAYRLSYLGTYVSVAELGKRSGPVAIDNHVARALRQSPQTGPVFYHPPVPLLTIAKDENTGPDAGACSP
jgi:hypothetical protein